MGSGYKPEPAVEKMMVLMKVFLASLTGMLFCTVFNGFAGGEPVKDEEKEKSELAVLMGEIDKNYKVLERLSTYFSFEEIEKELKIYGDASANLVTLCKTATTKFARPDDDTYQEINLAMLTASENIDGALRDKDESVTLEDVLWQIGRLRQTCADCHKHLDVKIGTGKHGKR
ncbi:MAG: hypothetical protein E3K38_12660 [Candidatus Kuenenia stuttgartiensis]|nr:hypothetical protein [Candidatus Kuenenia stuttgartiensis]